MSTVRVIGTEFDGTRMEYGNPQGDVDTAVANALGVLGVDTDYSIVSIRGAASSNVGHPELLATVGGVLSGLAGLEPPRELTNLTILPAGDGLNAIITTQIAPQPQ